MASMTLLLVIGTLGNTRSISEGLIKVAERCTVKKKKMAGAAMKQSSEF